MYFARRSAGDQLERLVEEKQIGIADDVLRGRSEVDDSECIRRRLSVRMDMCHDIVAELLLVRSRGFEIDVLEGITKLTHLIRGDFKTELVLRFGQRKPDPTPRRDAFPR